jgi:pyruvate/2-oxoglutarate dehydrogenase complex dihydrolipoamide acyltransferase (E2) component
MNSKSSMAADNSFPRRVDVVLPQFGMGMTGASVANWLKKQGDFVSEGEVLVEVETAKSVNEIVAPASGVLEAILVTAQQEVEVYAVLARIRIDAGAASIPG